METTETLSYPRDVEKLTVRIDALPETNRADYKAYLESRVFDLMGTIRPFGINGETAKLLLLDGLAAEEVAKGFPAPSLADVDEIFKSCWKMDAVQRAQRADEIESLGVPDSDRKPPKLFNTPTNGMASEVRMLTDFGAHTDVLLEVAVRKAQQQEELPDKLSEVYRDQVNKKCPNLRTAVSEVSAVEVIHERQQLTYRRFYEEEPVDPDRWDWLKGKQQALRKNDPVDLLMKQLFGGDGEKPAETSESSEPSAPVRRTRNTSISSVSSSGSRQASAAPETAGLEGAGGFADKKKSSQPSLKQPTTAASSRQAKNPVRKGK